MLISCWLSNLKILYWFINYSNSFFNTKFFFSKLYISEVLASKSALI